MGAAGWWFAAGALCGFLGFPLAVALSMWWVVLPPLPSERDEHEGVGWAQPATADAIVELEEPRWRGCNVPPEGWWCSRVPGHDGPCAARPIAVPTWKTLGGRSRIDTRGL